MHFSANDIFSLLILKSKCLNRQKKSLKCTMEFESFRIYVRYRCEKKNHFTVLKNKASHQAPKINQVAHKAANIFQQEIVDHHHKRSRFNEPIHFIIHSYERERKKKIKRLHHMLMHKIEQQPQANLANHQYSGPKWHQRFLLPS